MLCGFVGVCVSLTVNRSVSESGTHVSHTHTHTHLTSRVAFSLVQASLHDWLQPVGRATSESSSSAQLPGDSGTSRSAACDRRTENSKDETGEQAVANDDTVVLLASSDDDDGAEDETEVKDRGLVKAAAASTTSSSTAAVAAPPTPQCERQERQPGSGIRDCPYMVLAETFEAMVQTKSRLKITELLKNMLCSVLNATQSPNGTVRLCALVCACVRALAAVLIVSLWLLCADRGARRRSNGSCRVSGHQRYRAFI